MNAVKASTVSEVGQVGSRAVSVIVPTFNRAHLLMRAIKSALSQDHAPAEIIVVDDCSSDDTKTKIASYSGVIKLVYTRLEKNGGGAVARNAGIRIASSKYVAFLDLDDEWLPEHLRILTNAAERQSGDFAVASSAIKAGIKPRVLPGREYPESLGLSEKLHFVLSAELAFQTSTLIMPRTTALKYMFDPHLRRYQDWDLVCRLIERNVPIVLLPNTTVKYYPAVAGNITRTRAEQPSLRFLVKHRADLSKKTIARFVALQIMRRRCIGISMVKYLLGALVSGGISLKEFVYYTKESLFANNFSDTATGQPQGNRTLEKASIVLEKKGSS